MRMLLSFAVVAVGLFGGTPYLRADTAPTPCQSWTRPSRHRAVTAHGRGGCSAATGAGTVTLFDKDIPITSEQTVSLPDRSRLSIDIDKKAHVVAVLNGDKGWQSEGGPAVEMAGLRVKELIEEAYVMWLATVAPLKKPGFDLKPLPETKVNGKAAVGVLVSSKGHADAKLYFDKDTHLLVKIDREALQNGEKVQKEYLYGDYKDVDGVKLPTKLTENVNGKKFTEITGATYKLLKSVDDATFGKP